MHCSTEVEIEEEEDSKGGPGSGSSGCYGRLVRAEAQERQEGEQSSGVESACMMKVGAGKGGRWHPQQQSLVRIIEYRSMPASSPREVLGMVSRRVFCDLELLCGLQNLADSGPICGRHKAFRAGAL